jgi:hypothetical protein
MLTLLETLPRMLADAKSYNAHSGKKKGDASDEHRLFLARVFCQAFDLKSSFKVIRRCAPTPVRIDAADVGAEDEKPLYDDDRRAAGSGSPHWITARASSEVRQSCSLDWGLRSRSSERWPPFQWIVKTISRTASSVSTLTSFTSAQTSQKMRLAKNGFRPDTADNLAKLMRNHCIQDDAAPRVPNTPYGVAKPVALRKSANFGQGSQSSGKSARPSGIPQVDRQTDIPVLRL